MMFFLKIIFKVPLSIFKGIRRGFKRVGKKAASSSFLKWALRLPLIIFLALTATFVILFAWAFVATNNAILEGEFDTVPSRSKQITPGPGGSVDFDEITELINQVDLDAIPDNEPLGLDGTAFTIPPMGKKELMKTYKLFAEICANPLNDPDEGFRPQPWMGLGNWAHEGGMDLEGCSDPYRFWSTLFALYGSIYQMSDGEPWVASGLFGMASYSFEMCPRNIGNMSQPVYRTYPKLLSGAMPAYLYISTVENPDLSMDKRLHKGSYSSLESIWSQIEDPDFKKHSKFPSGDFVAERPSCQFLPDAAATFFRNAWCYLNGANIFSEAVGETSYRVSGSKDSFSNAGAEYNLFGAMAAGRSAQSYAGLYDPPGAEADIGSILLLGLDKTLNNGIDYFLSEEFITKCNKNKWDVSTTSSYMDAVCQEVFGQSRTALNSGSLVKETSVMQSIQALGVQSINGESIDFGSLASKFNSYISKHSGADNVEPPFTGLIQGTLGKRIAQTTKAVASQAIKDYPNSNYKPPDGSDGSVGGSSGDLDGDGKCDTCGESVYEDNPDCPDHMRADKLMYPLQGFQFACMADFHGSGGCSINLALHSGIDHRAYDVWAAGSTNIYAIADGVVVVNQSTSGGFGNLIVEAIPDSENPQIYMYYTHMATKGDFAVGSALKKGTIVGTQGHTGNSSGNHLHWEMRTSLKSGTGIDFLKSSAGRFYIQPMDKDGVDYNKTNSGWEWPK